ncbi:hypothetical protein GCM10009122_21940 [Fulvivirga kasyanovii]
MALTSELLGIHPVGRAVAVRWAIGEVGGNIYRESADHTGRTAEIASTNNGIHKH